MSTGSEPPKLMGLGELYNAIGALETLTVQVANLNRGLSAEAITSLREQPWYQSHLHDLHDHTESIRRGYEEFLRAVDSEAAMSIVWHYPRPVWKWTLSSIAEHAGVSVHDAPEFGTLDLDTTLLAEADPDSFVTVNDKVTGSSCSIAVVVRQLHNTNYPH